MGERGRTSAAALSVVPLGAIETIPRAKPPPELTEEQADEWRALVNRMPAEWFPRETHGMLAQYCRHIVTARRLSQLIAASETDELFDEDRYFRRLAAQVRETRAIASLATRMRLSQQTTYDKSKKKPSQAKRPWD